MVRIGELADRSGVPVKTIRYYEDIGVLTAPQRTSSGYRDYDHPAVDRLAFIRAAQAVGLTLGEIRQVVALRERGETPCTHVVDLLEHRAEEISQRIRELQRLQGDLRRLAARAHSLDPADCDPQRVCHVIAPAAQRDPDSRLDPPVQGRLYRHPRDHQSRTEQPR
jgi:DNA-binding transcriptional MerR regulator